MLGLKFVIGLLLIPACWVTIETFFLLFKNEALSGAFYKSPEFFFFTVGTAIALLFFSTHKRHPFALRAYVAGHEWTHAFFALLCRGKVTKIHISSKGGHIKTNRNNFLISLSPYFVPFYTIVTILLWGVLEWLFLDFQASHYFFLYGLIGLTWAIHICYTVMMLREVQTDIEINGHLFSYTVITLANMLIISSLLILASSGTTFREFGIAWINNFDSLGSRFLESVRELFAS